MLSCPRGNIKEFLKLPNIIPDWKIPILTKLTEAFKAKHSAKYLF